MSKDESLDKYKKLLEFKEELIAKIPYDIAKDIPTRVMLEMSIEKLEKLNPKYKPPKAPKEKKGLTPQEQDLADIKAFENPKFKIDIEDPRFAKLEPRVKNIYKDRFEEVSKLLEKELSVEEAELTYKKYDVKEPLPSETIKFVDSTIPIMSREEIDTVDQEKKIGFLKKYQLELEDKSLKDDIEKDELKSRVQALKKEVVKERYGIGE